MTLEFDTLLFELQFLGVKAHVVGTSGFDHVDEYLVVRFFSGAENDDIISYPCNTGNVPLDVI